jgi:hypothetical protein
MCILAFSWQYSAQSKITKFDIILLVKKYITGF